MLPEADHCLFCKETSLMLVASTLVIKGARFGKGTATLTIPDYVYTCCEKCGFEFLTSEQSKLNDRRKFYTDMRHT